MFNKHGSGGIVISSTESCCLVAGSQLVSQLLCSVDPRIKDSQFDTEDDVSLLSKFGV